MSQFLFSGLVLGCIYALVALGFVVLARVTGVINFATGEYVMLGGMSMAAMTRAGWSLWIAVPATVGAIALIGVTQERLTLAPVRNSNIITLAIITFGVSAVIRGSVLLIWGSTPRSVPAFTSSDSFSILGARLQWQSAWVVATTAVLLALFFLFFKYTTLGRAMRACADNPIAARLMGIRLSRMSMLAFGLAAGTAGLAGAVVTPITLVDYNTGLLLGLKGFVAALMAGFVSPQGAVAAGLGIGIAESVGAGLLRSQWKDAITFVLLLMFLFAQHFGLFAPPKQQLARIERGFQQFQVRRRMRRGADAARAHFQPAPLAARPEAPVAAWRRWVWLPAFGVIVAAFPFVFTSSYYQSVAVIAGVGAIGAIGLCLIIGYAGQLNLGFAGWLLIGGYTSGILNAKYGWNPMAAMPVAVIVAGIVAYLVGRIALRLQGLHLAAATLGVQFILAVVVQQWRSHTGGGTGLYGIDTFWLFGWRISDVTHYFYLVWALVIVCMIVGLNIDRSRTGRALRALSSSEPAAMSLAVDSGKYKMQMFIVSSMMAGLAGAMFAHYLRYISPATFGFDFTIAMISFAVVGGMRNVWGGVVGAVVVTFVREVVREVGGNVGGGDAAVYQIIVIGMMLVIVLILAPDGVVSQVQRGWAWLTSRWRRPRPPSPEGVESGLAGVPAPAAVADN